MNGGNMKTKKTIQELTIIDNFMFGAVMTIPENCKELLERVLQISIERVEISKEKIREFRTVIYGIMDKINAWDKDGTNFAYALNNQFTILNTCGHEGADQALHAKEIEALTYAVMALNVLDNEQAEQKRRKER